MIIPIGKLLRSQSQGTVDTVLPMNALEADPDLQATISGRTRRAWRLVRTSPHPLIDSLYTGLDRLSLVK